MIRLFSIEDHWLVTDGLRTKFRKSRDEIVITCSAETIEEAMKEDKDDNFDIILLDLFIPGTEPLDNMKQLMTRYPRKPIVILTGEEQEIWKMQAAEAGVAAWLTKHAKKEEMTDTIRRVFMGENLLREQMAKLTKPSTGDANHQYLFKIKPSEKELLHQLSRGLSQKKIADNLHVSESSIEKTLGKLRKQFSATNTLELVRALEKLHFFSNSDQTGSGH